MSMTKFALGDTAHAWIGSGFGEPIIPIVVQIVKVSSTQITASTAHGARLRFRMRDYRLINSCRGTPQLKPVDDAAMHVQQEAHALALVRMQLFASAGSLVSPSSWSNDPDTMRRIAEEFELFLRRVVIAGAVLPLIQKDWLRQRSGGE